MRSRRQSPPPAASPAPRGGGFGAAGAPCGERRPQGPGPRVASARRPAPLSSPQPGAGAGGRGNGPGELRGRGAERCRSPRAGAEFKLSPQRCGQRAAPGAPRCARRVNPAPVGADLSSGIGPSSIEDIPGDSEHRLCSRCAPSPPASCQLGCLLGPAWPSWVRGGCSRRPEPGLRRGSGHPALSPGSLPSGGPKARGSF